MSKRIDSALVWFRNDLRVEDHHGLNQAIAKCDNIIAYYSFNPNHYGKNRWGFKKTEKYRTKFLIESIKGLKAALKKLNITLIIDLESPQKTIPEIVKKYHVKHIYLQREWTEEELEEEKEVSKAIKGSISWERHYEQMLFHPQELPFDITQIPEVFGSFRKRCEKEVTIRPIRALPKPLPPSNLLEKSYELPQLSDLGLENNETDHRSAFPFRGGTADAIERLRLYFWENKKLSYYKNTRNGLIGSDYSSKFSPWLANGSISSKMIYWEIRRYEKSIQKNQSTYWLIFELIWRDYFKYISLKHGNKIFKIGGILERDYHWDTSYSVFENWCEGNTSEPFVNANMIELKQTGWMSNRGRQNVASFFTKDLKMDWRLGAAYFESMLLDYDVHSNYGNWMYVSGVGNDPRDRKFNIKWQSEKYDPEKKFSNLWLQ
jgi:deoxyribodipyrimidine photo-lyase